MSIEIQCMTEKLIVVIIKLDYSKVPSKSIVPTYESRVYVPGSRFITFEIELKMALKSRFIAFELKVII